MSESITYLITESVADPVSESIPEPLSESVPEPVSESVPDEIITTIHGYNVESVKTAFISAFIDKDEENSLFWGYELYYSNLKYEIFHLLNEIYNMFYVDKYSDYFNMHLQTLSKEWEQSKRKKHTILGSIIKNLVGLDISITDMVHSRKPILSVIETVKYHNICSSILDLTPITDINSLKIMTEEELVKLKKTLNKQPKNEKKKRVLPHELKIPMYVCEIFNINIDDSLKYMPYIDWCNIHSKNSITQTIVLRKKKKTNEVLSTSMLC